MVEGLNAKIFEDKIKLLKKLEKILNSLKHFKLETNRNSGGEKKKNETQKENHLD